MNALTKGSRLRKFFSFRDVSGRAGKPEVYRAEGPYFHANGVTPQINLNCSASCPEIIGAFVEDYKHGVFDKHKALTIRASLPSSLSGLAREYGAFKEKSLIDSSSDRKGVLQPGQLALEILSKDPYALSFGPEELKEGRGLEFLELLASGESGGLVRIGEASGFRRGFYTMMFCGESEGRHFLSVPTRKNFHALEPYLSAKMDGDDLVIADSFGEEVEVRGAWSMVKPAGRIAA